MSCDAPLLKTPRIIDDALLATYHDKPCYLTGSRYGIVAHHRIKRSKIHLDIPANLVPLADEPHKAVEAGAQNFIVYCTKMEKNGNPINSHGMSYAELYEWLTDANDELYDSLPGVLIQEPKPKSKYQFSRGIRK